MRAWSDELGETFATFNRDTRSAACKSVRPEMSSTIREILGSAGGGGGGADEDACAVSVASHLERLARDARLKMGRADVSTIY